MARRHAPLWANIVVAVVILAISIGLYLLLGLINNN